MTKLKDKAVAWAELEKMSKKSKRKKQACKSYNVATATIFPWTQYVRLSLLCFVRSALFGVFAASFQVSL